MKRKNIIGAVIVLSVSLSLLACNKKQDIAATTAMTETAATTEAAATEAATTEAAITGAETVQTQTEEETTSKAAEDTKDEAANAGMINPMEEVESSESFKDIGLSLYLPENGTWCSDAAYYIIGKEMAHIKCYDNITKSEAVVRTAKEELGDISGVYYKFDDTKEIQWEASVKQGETIKIKVQSVVDGSDIPGVLATWNYNGANYTLWEDEGKNDPTSVAKLAAEIAKQSAK